MEYKVTIELNKRQAGIVMAACEEYLRLRMGQCWDFANDLARAGYVYDKNAPCDETNFYAYIDRRDKMKTELEYAIRAAWPDGYVQARSPDGDIAGDVWTSIRHAIAYHDHPEGGDTVDFHPLIQMSSEPLPKVSISDE